MEFNTLLELQGYFGTELTCALYLERRRWGGMPTCPHCGSEAHSRTNTRLRHPELRTYKDFRCRACDRKYSVLTGTFFEGTKVDLKSWFAAMYLINSHKKGISSLQLARDIGVTQKTAWFMLHRIRQMFISEGGKMAGVVQMDESYLGGDNDNRHADKKTKGAGGRSMQDKAAVVGMYSEGIVSVSVVPHTGASVLIKMAMDNCGESATVVTDGYASYRNMGKLFKHVVIDHKKGRYASKDGRFHTNGIENFWSCLKRSIYGIYHWTSHKHLFRYCHESAHRYNTRGMSEGGRFALCLSRANGRLSYRELRENPLSLYFP